MRYVHVPGEVMVRESTVEDLTARLVESLQEENVKMRRSLEVYAEWSNWSLNEFGEWVVDIDTGPRVARRALGWRDE